jgi:Uma2 family endonuclease
LFPPDKIQLPPGSVVRLPATWQEYETLCQQRGDGSIPRIKYRDGEVLLMSPLPVHGRDAGLLADIMKALFNSGTVSNNGLVATYLLTEDIAPDSVGEKDGIIHAPVWVSNI